MIALAVLTLVWSSLSHAQQPDAPTVGEEVILDMTGELASEWAKRDSGPAKTAATRRGISYQTIASVAQVLKDGRMRIEHTSGPIRVGDKTQLLTLSAIVKPAEFDVDVTPKGTKIYSSPGDKKFTTTKREIRSFRIKLSNLSRAKLRLWTLAEEIGN